VGRVLAAVGVPLAAAAPPLLSEMALRGGESEGALMMVGLAAATLVA
jgi:hypothetical protein